jgi:hypothetical protein
MFGERDVKLEVGSPLRVSTHVSSLYLEEYAPTGLSGAKSGACLISPAASLALATVSVRQTSVRQAKSLVARMRLEWILSERTSYMLK